MNNRTDPSWRFLVGVVIAGALLAIIGLIDLARGDLVEDYRLRPSKPFRKAIASGKPSAELCKNDRRDMGKAVLVLETQEICVCFGEAKGWICK